jgi:hypothetical protein
MESSGDWDLLVGRSLVLNIFYIYTIEAID